MSLNLQDMRGFVLQYPNLSASRMSASGPYQPVSPIGEVAISSLLCPLRPGILQEAVTLERVNVERHVTSLSAQSPRECYRIVTQRISSGDREMDGTAIPMGEGWDRKRALSEAAIGGQPIASNTCRIQAVAEIRSAVECRIGGKPETAVKTRDAQNGAHELPGTALDGQSECPAGGIAAKYG